MFTFCMLCMKHITTRILHEGQRIASHNTVEKHSSLSRNLWRFLRMPLDERRSGHARKELIGILHTTMDSLSFSPLSLHEATWSQHLILIGLGMGSPSQRWRSSEYQGAHRAFMHHQYDGVSSCWCTWDWTLEDGKADVSPSARPPRIWRM